MRNLRYRVALLLYLAKLVPFSFMIGYVAEAFSVGTIYISFIFMLIVSMMPHSVSMSVA